MRRNIATTTHADREQLLEFVRSRHHLVLSTTRSDGSPQMSPVTGGVDEHGRIVISTYPGRAKAANIRKNPNVSICVLSGEFNGAWVQVNGTAEVIDMPEAVDGLVDYFRSISGEHPDWDEYREAMRTQNKSLIRVTPMSWSPIATGGFPPEVAAELDADD